MEDYCGREEQHHCLVYMAYMLERLRSRAQNASGLLEKVLDVCLGRNTQPPNSFFFSQMYREK